MKINKFILKQIFDIKTYGIRELFRKLYLLIKIMARIPIDIIAIAPCVIIRLISPLIIIRIAKVPSSNYGPFARCLPIYYYQKKLKINQPTKKHIDLLYIHYRDKIYNKQLAKMWERRFIFLSGYLLNPIDRINKLIPGWKTHTIEFLRQDFYNLIEKYQPFDFTPDEEAHGKEMLNKFGLKDDDKFVCFAIRDSAYQLRKIPSRFRDWSYQDFRHQDIDNFVLAAEELTKRGYYVFRMGVVVHKAFNSNNPKIIDYPFSGLRSDFMDVYLGAKCSFCLSTGMGFDDVPYIFRRPIALIQCPIGNISRSHAHSEKFLIITKHHILKKENRRLSLSEIFSHGVAYTHETEIFNQKGIELVDNTPDEIKDLVVEMADNLEFKKKLNHEDEELQKTFRSLFASNFKSSVESYGHPRTIELFLFNEVRSSFSTKFLKENKNWLQ